MKRRLFQASTYETLSKIYGIDFDSPKDCDDAPQFFAQRDLLLQIENTSLSNEAIHLRIKKLLKGVNADRKMAELGMILFYLDKLGELPDTKSLLAYRAEEICSEVKSYLQDHLKAGANKHIPSGKTHYLMRAFAHMVFTKDQVYNKGCLLAIRELLSDPTFKISLYLQPEHRDHILTVLGQLISKTSFDTLFQTKATAHRDLEEVIRLDLKMGPEDEIGSVHIFYDCMMALFADIRQVNAPNCYAVGSLIYTTENHTYKTLSKLLQWIKEGHYTTDDSVAVPISPLLEKRMIYCSDLDPLLDVENTFLLAPFKKISTTLDLDHSKVKVKGKGTLKKTLSGMLHANGSSEHILYAEKLYYAYKYNILVHLQLAVIEFAFMNASGTKKEMVDICIEGIRKGMITSVDYQVMEMIKKKLDRRIRLQNCNETDVTLKNGKLVVSGQRISKFSGNVKSLLSLFQTSLRVFSLEDGKHSSLNSISDLQRMICRQIEEIDNDLGKGCGDFKRIFADAVNSKAFKRHVSNSLANQINARGISGKNLNEADLLLLKQDGGKEDVAIDLVYGISLCKETVMGCNTPYQFLEELLHQLKYYDVSLIKSAPRLLIATCGDHTWTLAPSCWKLLLENKKTFNKFVQEAVFNPAKKRLASKIPSETMYRIIERYTPEEVTRKEMEAYFERFKCLSHSQFSVDLFDNIRRDRVAELQSIIEEEFIKVTLSKPEFSRVLKELNISVSKNQYHQLYDQLPKTSTLPFKWAKVIRTTLIKGGIAIEDPYEIELAICKTKRLPLPFNLGDLNWTESYSEDPVHLRLMINFSWVSGTPCYFIRDSEKEDFEPNFNYNKVIIHHPRTKIRSPRW